MAVPHVAPALHLDVRASLVRVDLLHLVAFRAVAKRPKLHALNHAPVGVAKHAIVLIEPIGAREVVVSVDSKHAQHVPVVPVPAVIDAVVQRPVGNFSRRMANGPRHRIDEARLLRRRQPRVHPEHLRHLAVVAVVAEHADLHGRNPRIQRGRQVHLHVINRIDLSQHQGDAAVVVPHNRVRPEGLPMQCQHMRIVWTREFYA